VGGAGTGGAPAPWTPQSDPRFGALSQDPAHGNKVTPGSANEAVVGLTLEHEGKVPGPISRSPDPRSEFVDGNGQSWDVKSPVSEEKMPARNRPPPPGTTGPRPGSFVLSSFEQTVSKETTYGNNVMIDTSNLNASDTAALKAWAQGTPPPAALKGKSVVFYP
jgi:hypothetical protein